jgi:hypothetical protein
MISAPELSVNIQAIQNQIFIEAESSNEEIQLLTLNQPAAVIIQPSQGPQGPTGPQGIPGTSSGVAIVNESAEIPVSQGFTLVEASGAIILTLPPISEVLVNGVGQSFSIRLISSYGVMVVGSGSDEIENGAAFSFQYAGTAYTFVPTTSGWFYT